MGNRDWYGPGSRIIITTRNKRIVDWVEVDQPYGLSGLDSCQALLLFSQHAFRKNKPPKEYNKLSMRIVEITGGLPLAIEVFGSLLYGRNKEEWGFILKKLEKVPPKEVSLRLRISYEALDDWQKDVFLDIACFFIGESVRRVIYFWDDSHFPEEAIEVLKQMSLIKIQNGYEIWMHDQLRDLGREIVRQEQNCNRLWDKKEIGELFARKVISENIRGINFIQIFKGERNNIYREGSLFREDLARLPNLQLLHVDFHNANYGDITKWKFWKKSLPVFSNLRWLSWSRFPYKVYRSNFSVENLVTLELSSCGMKSDWGGWKCIQTAKKLKVLKLEQCNRLVTTPNVSYHPLLERLFLITCLELVEIDESLGMLEHLQIICFTHCYQLRKLPEKLSCTESLEVLIIEHASIVEIPKWPIMTRLEVLHIIMHDDSGIVSSLELTDKLKELSFEGMDITALPDSFGNLVKLQGLSLRSCRYIKTLPESIGDFLSLTELDLSFSGIVVPSNIKLPQSLISLKAICKDTQIPDLSSLINLKILELLMSEDEDYPFEGHDPAPSWIGRLTNLEKLTLSIGRITRLHADLGTLFKLTSLSIKDCSSLGTLLDLPSGLTSLIIDGCGALETLLDLPSGLTRLSIGSCSSLGTLLHLPSSLTSLAINNCKSLTLNICSCKSLEWLRIEGCNLSEIDGLEVLEYLTSLCIINCANLQRLPDLSNLKMLEGLSVCFCPKLIEIPGRLKSLDYLRIEDCESLERILDIPKSESLPLNVRIRNCGKIEDVRTSNFSNSFRPIQSTIAALRRLFRNICCFG